MLSRRILVAGLLMLVAAGLDGANAYDPVDIDNLARYGEFPHHVQIYHEIFNAKINATELHFQCSGALIRPNFVLTSASCLYGLAVKSMVVKLGGRWRYSVLVKRADDPNDVNAQYIRGNASYTHPQWNASDPLHDVLLLQLIKPAVLDLSYTNTVALLTQLNESSAQMPHALSGWRLREDQTPDGQLHFYHLYEEQPAYCKSIYDTNNTQACASYPLNRKVYAQIPDDLGCPLVVYDAMHQPVLAGIVTRYNTISHGVTFYVRVADYADWIDKQVNGAAAQRLGALALVAAILVFLVNAVSR